MTFRSVIRQRLELVDDGAQQSLERVQYHVVPVINGRSVSQHSAFLAHYVTRQRRVPRHATL